MPAMANDQMTPKTTSPPRSSQRDQTVRRVGSGDEHVDAAVVEDLEDVLDALLREAVVERRGGVLEHQCDAVHQSARDRPAVVALAGVHQQDRQRRDRESDSQPVDDAVGDLLAQRVGAALRRAHLRGRGADVCLAHSSSSSSGDGVSVHCMTPPKAKHSAEGSLMSTMMSCE